LNFTKVSTRYALSRRATRSPGAPIPHRHRLSPPRPPPKTRKRKEGGLGEFIPPTFTSLAAPEWPLPATQVPEANGPPSAGPSPIAGGTERGGFRQRRTGSGGW